MPVRPLPPPRWGAQRKGPACAGPLLRIACLIRSSRRLQRNLSRYQFACEAFSTTKEAYAFPVFEAVFKEFDLPKADPSARNASSW